MFGIVVELLLDILFLLLFVLFIIHFTHGFEPHLAIVIYIYLIRTLSKSLRFIMGLLSWRVITILLPTTFKQYLLQIVLCLSVNKIRHLHIFLVRYYGEMERQLK